MNQKTMATKVLGAAGGGTNDLLTQFPNEVARRLGLTAGDSVDYILVGGEVIVKKAEG